MTIATPFHPQTSWRPKMLLFGHSIILLLFISLLLPFTANIWNQVDDAFFRLVNEPLRTNSYLRTLSALANHRFADWLEDLCILGFYLAALWKTPKDQRLRKGAEFIFCVLLTALTILLINRLVCRDFLRLRRASPTLVLDNPVNLSHFISWVQIKVDSTKSFPGDHATTALMFAVSYAYFMRGKLGLFALIYGVLLCLPRLAVGAHWLSDLIIGSGSIVLFSFSWAFFTPFSERCILAIQKGMKKLGNRLTDFYS